MKSIRKIFLAGLLVLLPIVGTLSLILWLFNIIDSIFRVPIEKFMGFSIIGIGVIINIVIIFTTGIIATNFLGKKCIHFTERIFGKIPLVRSIYMSIKQLINTVFMEQENTFKKPVLIQYPSKGIYTIGFITADAANEISELVLEKMKSIFIPTTPNPTSGMFVMVPQKDIIPLNMPVDSAIKLIVSGGILLPERVKKGGN